MKIVLTLFMLVLVVLITTWITRALLARSLPDLKPWHRPILTAEYRARNHRGGISFADYRALEVRLMEEVQTLIVEPLARSEHALTNRYFAGSPAHASAWPSNHNLSFEKIPQQPRGGVILLHGASDSPYSMHALATSFFNAGYYVIAPRMPGHGTIPGELTMVRPQDWTSIVPMAWAQTRSTIGADKPIYIAGYSTGAAVALNYALDALEDKSLEQAAGILMYSPALGVSGFASFARWDYLISKLPGFEKFGWVGVRPEYNPFKYTSFPKQAGHLVHTMSSRNQDRIEKLRHSDRWQSFPPTIAFQSIVDNTVSVDAIVDIYRDLPRGKNQLVLFDVNRSSFVTPFLRNDGKDILRDLSDQARDGIDVTIVRNQDGKDTDVIAARHAGGTDDDATITPLGLRWPSGVFSLSHVAIPFPDTDPLYGSDGAQFAPAGYNIGNVRAIGERSVLVVPAADSNRIKYNPFFAYLQTRSLDFLGVAADARPGTPH